MRDVNRGTLSHASYAVQRTNGTFKYGEKDERCVTHLLDSGAFAEDVNVSMAA